VKVWFAIPCGLVAAFVLRVLFHLSHLTHISILSPVLECTIGAIIAGYIAKKKGAIWGSTVAYLWIFIEVSVWWWITRAFSPGVRDAKLYDSGNLNWTMFLSATAIFLGLLGGKVGELLSERSNRGIKNPPTRAI
jgi:H+/Cl- antiporter ClcA